MLNTTKINIAWKTIKHLAKAAAHPAPAHPLTVLQVKMNKVTVLIAAPLHPAPQVALRHPAAPPTAAQAVNHTVSRTTNITSTQNQR